MWQLPLHRNTIHTTALTTQRDQSRFELTASPDTKRIVSPSLAVLVLQWFWGVARELGKTTLTTRRQSLTIPNARR